MGSTRSMFKPVQVYDFRHFLSDGAFKASLWRRWQEVIPESTYIANNLWMQDKQKALFWFVLLHEIHHYLNFCAVSNLHFPVQERQLLILIRTIFMSFFPNRESTQNFSHVLTCNVILVCACERRSTLILKLPSPFHDSFNFAKFMFMWCVTFFTFIMCTISTAVLNILTLEKMI